MFYFHNKETTSKRVDFRNLLFIFFKKATSRVRHCTGLAWSPIAWYRDYYFFFFNNDSEALENHNCLLNYHRKKKKKKDLEEEFNVKCI